LEVFHLKELKTDSSEEKSGLLLGTEELSPGKLKAADGTDGDGTDGTDGDGADGDGTDGDEDDEDGTDTDGTDGDADSKD